LSIDRKAYDELVDFFARGARSKAILEYSPSGEAQDRVRYLLQKKKADALKPDEVAELVAFGRLEHFMQLIKARAHRFVNSSSGDQGTSCSS